MPGIIYPPIRPIEPEDIIDARPRLTATDYCDADAAIEIAAYVRLAKGNQTLDLCKHHFDINEAALLAAGWIVTDDRRADLH